MLIFDGEIQGSMCLGLRFVIQLLKGLRQKDHKFKPNLSHLYSSRSVMTNLSQKTEKRERGWSWHSVEEHLPSVCKILKSIPSTVNKNNSK